MGVEGGEREEGGDGGERGFGGWVGFEGAWRWARFRRLLGARRWGRGWGQVPLTKVLSRTAVPTATTVGRLVAWPAGQQGLG